MLSSSKVFGFISIIIKFFYSENLINRLSDTGAQFFYNFFSITLKKNNKKVQGFLIQFDSFSVRVRSKGFSKTPLNENRNGTVKNKHYRIFERFENWVDFFLFRKEPYV